MNAESGLSDFYQPFNAGGHDPDKMCFFRCVASALSPLIPNRAMGLEMVKAQLITVFRERLRTRTGLFAEDEAAFLRGEGLFRLEWISTFTSCVLNELGM